jgi:hypothetical protein
MFPRPVPWFGLLVRALKLRRIDAGFGKAGKRLFRRIAADATNGEALTHRLRHALLNVAANLASACAIL